MAKHAWIANTEQEYIKLGLQKNSPAIWEDGLRINGKKGEYEWWYFDCKLKDGSSLVIVFYSAPMFNFSEGLKAHATFNFTKPNGKTYSSKVEAALSDCNFSKNRCEIKIGDCTVRGNLKNYEIYWKDDKIEATVSLKGNVPAWRPKSGHLLFDEKDYFAWLPSVPEGNAEVRIKTSKTEKFYSGSGYHDHNWGNIPMFFLMHHWYWGRAKIGEYQVVSSYITAGKKYSYDEIPIFMIAKGGEILADEPEKYLSYSEKDYFYDEITEKHIANRLIYDYNDGTQHYRITYVRESDIEKTCMKQILSKLQYAAIYMLGMRGAYQRMTGTATLERFENDTLVETVTAPALWELMYFGKDRKKN